MLKCGTRRRERRKRPSEDAVNFLKYFRKYFAIIYVDKVPGSFAIVFRWLNIHTLFSFIVTKTNTFVYAGPSDPIMDHLDPYVETQTAIS